MAKVKYDVSDVEDLQDFKQAPKGTYQAKIVETTVGESSAGQPMLTIVMELTKDSKGKKLKEKYGRIWHRVPLEHWEDTAGWTFRLKEFIKALGLKEKGSFDPEKLEGKELMVVVRAGKDLDDNYRAEAGKLMPLASDEDEDEDEDVEDEDAEDEDDDDADAEEDEDDDEDEEGEEEEEDDEEDDEDEDEVEDYSEWSRNEMVKEARSRGLTVKKGTTEDDLREMLVDDDSSEEEEDEEDEDDAEEVDYNDWEVDDLKKELKERGLKTNGSKKQMVARLTKDDEAGDDPF